MLDIAEARFARRGFHRVGVEEIADEADVSVGTVYTHFGSKDQLYLAVAHRGVEQLVRHIATKQQLAASPTEQVIAVGQVCMRELRDRPFLCRFLLADSTEPSDTAVRASIGERMESLYRSFADLVQAAIDAGEFRPVDAYLFARYLVGSWAGVLTAASHTGTPLSAERADQCLNQAIEALRVGLLTTNRSTILEENL